jgi:hypothetical protein
MVPGRAICLLLLAACGADASLGRSVGRTSGQAHVAADTVKDLFVAPTTDSTEILRSPRVDRDVGTGRDGDPGIWVSANRLKQLPTSGAAWNGLLSAADRPCGTVNLADQDQATNVCVMAKGLVFARIGGTQYRADVVRAIGQVVSAPAYRGRALALGRESLRPTSSTSRATMRFWTHASAPR